MFEFSNYIIIIGLAADSVSRWSIDDNRYLPLFEIQNRKFSNKQTTRVFFLFLSPLFVMNTYVFVRLDSHAFISANKPLGAIPERLGFKWLDSRLDLTGTAMSIDNQYV